MLKAKPFLFLTILLLAFIGLNNSSATEKYEKFSDEQLDVLVPSSSGFVQSLAGKWQISYEDGATSGKTIEVPGSEPKQKFIIYQRTIKLSPELRQKYAWYLNFNGIDNVTEVYFNDQYVEKYFSSMSPFTVRIPDKIMNNTVNKIRLKVLEAESTVAQVQSQNVFAKKIYTGVIRDLMLVGTPQIHVSAVKYTTKFNRDLSSCKIKSKISVTAADIKKIRHSVNDSIPIKISNNSVDVKIEAYIVDMLTGQPVTQVSSKIIKISSDRTIEENFELRASNLRLWSPGTPDLYELNFKITKSGQVIDHRKDIIGFRDIRIMDKNNRPRIFLNGREFEIEGVDYIEDSYGNYQTFTAAQMEQDVKLMKKLGINVVRFKFSAPHPYFAHLCDKYGLLMLVEIPVYDIPNLLIGSDEIKKNMRNVARRLIAGYDNHPSLMAWGLMEGLQEGSAEAIGYKNYIMKFFRQQSKHLIYKTAVLNSEEVDIEGYDFIGLRDIGKYRDFDNTVANLTRMEALTTKIPVYVNYGVSIHPDNHNGYSDPLSVESQANYLFNLFHAVQSMDYSGSLIWSFSDYLLENPFLMINYRNQYLCTSGLVDRQRRPRFAFTTMLAMFNKEKEPLLHAGSYEEEAPLSFIIFGLSLSIFIIFLINRFKRFREYLFRSILRPYNFYADIRDQRIMSSVQTVFLGLAVSFTLGIFLSSIMYFYRTDEMLQHILMLLLPANWLQELIFRLVWIPELFIVIISSIFFAGIFAVAGLLKLASTLVRGRIFYIDTYTIVIWSGTPILLLLPISIILSRLMSLSPAIVTIALFLLVIIMIMVFLRLLRSSAVVFDVRPYKVYIVGFAFTGLVLFITGVIYQLQFSTLSYANHLIDIILGY